jgi:hypothetical protein
MTLLTIANDPNAGGIGEGNASNVTNAPPGIQQLDENTASKLEQPKCTLSS